MNNAEKRLKLLEAVAYLAEGMRVARGERNLGEADEWEHKLNQALEEFYDNEYG